MRPPLVIASAIFAALLLLTPSAAAANYSGFGTYTLTIGDWVNVHSTTGLYADYYAYKLVDTRSEGYVQFELNKTQPVNNVLRGGGDLALRYYLTAKSLANQNLEEYTGVNITLQSATNYAASVTFQQWVAAPTPYASPIATLVPANVTPLPLPTSTLEPSPTPTLRPTPAPTLAPTLAVPTSAPAPDNSPLILGVVLAALALAAYALWPRRPPIAPTGAKK